MQIKKPRLWLFVLGGVLLVGIIFVIASLAWYNSQLKPYDASNTQKVQVTIESGMSARDIGKLLEEKQMIRSALAMSIYLKLDGSNNDFHAGVYSVSQSQSLAEIIDYLTSHAVDQKKITFYPGAMLRDKSDKPIENKRDVWSVLLQAGYTEVDIERALAASYSGTVLSGRPAGAGLEGYIYGETYFVPADASVEQILQVAIDEFSKVVEDNNLEELYSAQGLTLFEGITLASVIEREVSCANGQVCDDQKQVAQVFFKRLKEGISLGADATFRYAADTVGKKPTVDFDSPYNTRLHQGLPPGPISAPGLGALLAVAHPAEGDFLFFVSGDDDVNYFSRTMAEHNSNIREHCHEKCMLP